MIWAYIGRGLRKDQAEMAYAQLLTLTESLRRRGFAVKVISAAIAASKLKIA